MLGKFMLFMMKIGLPLVYGYHFVCSSVFLNTAHEEASGLERLGNALLAPSQFLLVGKAVSADGQFEQRFTYDEHLMVKTVCAMTAFPVSLTLGSTVKGLAYLSGEVRERHAQILVHRSTPRKGSHIEYYKSLGMEINDYKKAPLISSQGYERRESDLNHLERDRLAFKEILEILHAHDIPCWVDCGTCLGTYRYGGIIPWDHDIDIGMMAKDSDRTFRALQELDPTKYVVQDWASRDKPQTYLKVYVRATGTLIDLYHFAIDEKGGILRSIVSNEDSIFLPESWKIRERRYTIPVPYSVLFPLKKALFDGIEVPVPNDIERYLKDRYGENLDPIYLYNEKTGKYEKDESHPYWQLPYVK